MNDPLFCYRCLDCSLVYAVACGETIRCPCGSKERAHTASLDPREFICALANAEPREAVRMVRGLREEDRSC